MNTNNDDFQQQQNADRIASRISGEIANQKRKDRKHYLRIEIAKATDRTVKAELQLMLDEIEHRERIQRIASVIIGVILLMAVTFFGFTRLFYPGSESDKQAAATSSIPVANTNTSIGGTNTNSSADTSKTDSANSNDVDTTKLTEQQIKEWVAAVLNAETGRDFIGEGIYELNSVVKGGLVYINLDPVNVQTDRAAIFRVNEQGFLQQDSFHLSRLSEGEWITVSTKYMDVSQVPDWTATSSTNIQESSAENADSSSQGDVSAEKSKVLGEGSIEETPELASSSAATDNHTRAETVRTIMQANQGLDPEILANISDEDILAANAGNATNSQIAQTAQNLINKYPELKK